LESDWSLSGGNLPAWKTNYLFLSVMGDSLTTYDCKYNFRTFVFAMIPFPYRREF
jgi:hypothetical protein